MNNNENVAWLITFLREQLTEVLKDIRITEYQIDAWNHGEMYLIKISDSPFYQTKLAGQTSKLGIYKFRQMWLQSQLKEVLDMETRLDLGIDITNKGTKSVKEITEKYEGDDFGVVISRDEEYLSKKIDIVSWWGNFDTYQRFRHELLTEGYTFYK